MVNCNLEFVNVLKAVTILLGYTGGRKTTENFCTSILFLTLIFFFHKEYYKEMIHSKCLLFDHKGQANVSISYDGKNKEVINANKLFTLDFSKCAF